MNRLRIPLIIDDTLGFARSVAELAAEERGVLSLLNQQGKPLCCIPSAFPQDDAKSLRGLVEATLGHDRLDEGLALEFISSSAEELRPLWSSCLTAVGRDSPWAGDFALPDDWSPLCLYVTDEEYPRVGVGRSNKLGSLRNSCRLIVEVLPKVAFSLIQSIRANLGLRWCHEEKHFPLETPCSEGLTGRCVAPCTFSLHSHADSVRRVEYNARVDALLSLLSTGTSVSDEAGVAALNELCAFERSAVFQESVAALNRFVSVPRHHLCSLDRTDTLVFDQGVLDLVAQFRGKPLKQARLQTPPEVRGVALSFWLSLALAALYEFGLPNKIQLVGSELSSLTVWKALGEIHGRTPPLVQKKRATLQVTTCRELVKLNDHAEVRHLKSVDSSSVEGSLLDLTRYQTIIALDCAHSGGARKQQVVGAVVARVQKENVFTPVRSIEIIESFALAVPELPEPEALATVVPHLFERQLLHAETLLLVDGGIVQRRAVESVLSSLGGTALEVSLVAASKGSGKHSSISEFIVIDEEPIEFNVHHSDHAELLGLRDKVHALVNEAHSCSRDLSFRFAGSPRFSVQELIDRQSLILLFESRRQ